MSSEHPADSNETNWERLKEIGISERHFNEIESGYRKLASTWLLASFGGMGFVAEASSLPLPKEVIIFAISFAGSAGVQLLWVIDLLAYHHLLSAYFLEGLKIEASAPELPQVRWNMLHQGIVERRVRLFYAGCSLVLLPFGIGAILAGLGLGLYGGVAMIAALVPVGTTVLLWGMSHNKWLTREVARIPRSKQESAGTP